MDGKALRALFALIREATERHMVDIGFLRVRGRPHTDRHAAKSLVAETTASAAEPKDPFCKA